MRAILFGVALVLAASAAEAKGGGGRVSYGGGHHTSSHGGHYSGGSGSPTEGVATATGRLATSTERIGENLSPASAGPEFSSQRIDAASSSELSY